MNIRRSTELALIRLRYAIATQLEDAEDLLPHDAENARLLRDQAMHLALPYVFRQRGMWIPRQKELIAAVAAVDPTAGAPARQFYREPEATAAYAIAVELVSHVSGETRFFEWESEREPVADAP